MNTSTALIAGMRVRIHDRLLVSPFLPLTDDLRLMMYLITLLLSLAPNAAPLHPPKLSEVSLADGTILGGVHNYDALFIPGTATVWVEADLEIRATGLVRIEGRLLAFDAASLGQNHAPDISISSPLVIDIPGTVLGGQGRYSVSTHGGDGSSIILTAPLVYIDGLVNAGNGGKGGWASDGGRGGDAYVNGYFNIRELSDRSSLVSGRGGDGGYPGGDGGESGGAIAQVSDDAKEQFLSLQSEIVDALAMMDEPPEEPAPSPTCGNGVAGGHGGNSESPDAANGAPGTPGTETVPNGGLGGNGRPSGAAAGGDGSPGNAGLDCCSGSPNTGGTGGKGGKGGNAKSGKGGDGGTGGGGYNGTNPGGKGGDGADSGSSKGGKAGNGGNGGKQHGLGGNPGILGTTTSGAGGSKGLGGSGMPTGTDGTAGSKGTETQSSSGTGGNPGGNC